MLKIFISHSWGDNAAAKKLADLLKRGGIEVRIDFQIPAGYSWQKHVNDAITWCDVFILLWSKKAEVSHWVNLELEAALQLINKRIIPCLLDDTKRPPLIGSRVYIDFKDFEGGYKSLSDNLKLNVNGENAKEPPILLIENVKTMLKHNNFYDSDYNKAGMGIKNNFEESTNKGYKIVKDKESGLIWQKAGSAYPMGFGAVSGWIKKQNEIRYAGLNEWRLPRLEEAMALMRPLKNKRGLYIDEIFDNMQTAIWTSDIIKKDVPWVVFYNIGSCSRGYLLLYEYYIRAVHNGEAGVWVL
mgnify:CR=1 FL=1